MRVSGFFLLATAASVAAFQPSAGTARPSVVLGMGKDYLDSLNSPSSESVVETKPSPAAKAEEEALSKVASSAKGPGKLFQDIGGDLASIGGEVASSVAGQVAAGWDKQRLNKLQKARLNDVIAELSDLSAQWEKATLEQREGVLEEAFTTTFKLLQTVQNQEDGIADVLSEDIKDLEALATKRIVLKKTKKEELMP